MGTSKLLTFEGKLPPTDLASLIERSNGKMSAMRLIMSTSVYTNKVHALDGGLDQLIVKRGLAEINDRGHCD